jgi:hypothetical protein
MHVFFWDADCAASHVEFLRPVSERDGLAVRGYCLRPNHAHLVAASERPNSPGGAVGATHWHYTRRVNGGNGAWCGR